MRGKETRRLRTERLISVVVIFAISSVSLGTALFSAESKSQVGGTPLENEGRYNGGSQSFFDVAMDDLPSGKDSLGYEDDKKLNRLNLHRGYILGADDYSVTLGFDIGSLSISQRNIGNERYMVFDSPDFATTSGIGRPQLPVVRRLVAVPQEGNVRLSTLLAEYQYFGEGKVYPFQKPLPEGKGDAEFVIDEDFYSKDTFYPDKVADIQVLGSMRGLKVALLQVNPIRFNPQREIIEICHSIRLRLEYSTSFKESFKNPENIKASPAFRDFLRETLLNYETLDGIFQSEERANYLIITADVFYSSVVPLAEWKEVKGLEVKIVNLSSIGNSDIDIRDYVYDAYHNWELPPSYLLLVGDVEYLPTHYGLYHEYEENYTATDLFYATVDGSDYLPDIYVGRISVKTTQEANATISKIVDYEKDPYVAERDWYREVVVVSDKQSGRPFEETSNYVYNFLTNRGYNVTRVYHSLGGDTSDISKNVNSGRLIVNYRGHGERTGWYRPAFHNSDVTALSNGRKLPIVIGPTCRSAWFDHPSITSFGEMWVKVADKGSVGHFGSSRVSYSYYNDELDKGVYWAMFNDNLHSFGQLTDKAKIYMMEKYGYYDDITHLQFEMYNVLGDPELNIWITTPPLPDDVGTDSIDSLLNGGKYLKGPRNITATVKNYGGSLSQGFNVSAEVKQIATQTFGKYSDNMENYTSPNRGHWQLVEWERDVGEWESGTPTNVGPGGAHSGDNCWGTDLDDNYDNYGATTFAGFVVDQGIFVDVYARNDFLDIPAQAGDHIYINISWTTGADLDLYLYKPSDVLSHSITGSNYVAIGYSASTEYEYIDYVTSLSDESGIYKLRVHLFSGGNTAYSIDEITVDNVTYTGSDYPNSLKRVDDESSDYPEVTNHYFWAYADYGTYYVEYSFDYDIDLTLYDPDGDVRLSNTLDNDGYWEGTFEADEYGLWRVKMMGYGPDDTVDSYTLSVFHPDHSALLVSPVIDLSDPNIISSELEFWHWYDLEDYYDYAYFLVGTEDLIWLGGRYYTGSNSEIGWSKETVSLDEFVGLRIRLAFLLSSDSSITKPGWYVDDINITVASRVQETLFLDDIEAGIGDWTSTGFWHQVEDGVDAYNNSHSPTHSWWYGQDSTGDYDNGVQNSGNLTSPSIDIGEVATATLSFWSWFETEDVKAYDKKIVQISVNGSGWIDVLQVSDNLGVWEQKSVDLTPFVGGWIQIRFLFDTVDEFGNNFRGWYVDDVSVYVATEVTVFGPEMRSATAMGYNETIQVNWSYNFQNSTYYRVIVKTLLPDDLDLENDEKSVMIEVVDYLPPVLFVHNLWSGEYRYYKASLDLSGYDYDFTHPVEEPSWSSILTQYEVVVWATHGSLTNLDQSNLRTYLDGGGNLLISGEDIGYYLVHHEMGMDFYHNYLHATYVKDDTDALQIVGVPMDPISDGLPPLVIGGSWPSEVAPRDDFSSTVFTYPGDGNASIKAYTGTYKVVYLACNLFEGPESIAIKATVMDRIIKWLRLPNQPPKITHHEPLSDPTINEGESQVFNITVYDPDGTTPTVRWMLDGDFVGDADSYIFDANYTSSGQHIVNVTITDGQYFDYHEWILTVNNVNRLPTIESYYPATNPTITEEDSQLFSISASDPDGDPIAIEWSLSGELVQNGSSYTFIADYDSAGVYDVLVVVSDGNSTNSHSWLLTVINVNRLPIIDSFYPLEDPNITEEQSQLFFVTASDPDGDVVTIEWYLDGQLVKNGSLYTFVADYQSAGGYEVLVVVSDGYFCAYHVWNLTVMNVVRPPQLIGAELTGSNLENVTIMWALSPDDPASVERYEVYYGTIYHRDGSGYEFLGFSPKGIDSYVHSHGGRGDPNNYFYYVVAEDPSNNSWRSQNQAGKFTRMLSEGPNLISVPLIQSERSIEGAFQTIEFDKAWTYDSFSKEWKSYMKSKPWLGDLGSVNHSIGFWINVTRPSGLTVAGLVPSTATTTLKAGWNLVSFPSFDNDYLVANLKAELNATAVEGFDPLNEPYYLRPMQDTENLEPGFAYWVKVPADCVWIIAS